MSTRFADRDLLYGVLAVQMEFVDRRHLIDAVQVRHADEADSLGEILVKQGALSQDSKCRLDALVEEHLALHSNDAAKSLATLSGTDSLEDELRTLGFPDLNATLAHLTTAAHVTTSNSSRRNSTHDAGTRFQIKHMHAKGGIGQVSVALDRELSRDVALKELQTHFADNHDARARFVLEAEITGGLEHPGVVPVYGLGHYADGRPFYAMRFVHGDSMHDATNRFHQQFAKEPADDGFELELRKLLQRFIDVCNAMEYAHSRGVLHRDLKPGNIMLGNYGETLVVDWGLAKAGTQAKRRVRPVEESALLPPSASDSAPTQLGSTVGTPHYMSPEQAAGRIDELDSTSDVYSLGATLYHLLTGRPPFEGSDIGVVLAAVETGIFPPPRTINSRITKPLEAICLKAMAHRPADRYRSARALAEDIQRCLADESIEAMPDSGLQKIQRWARRHRGVTLATGIGLLLVATVSAISSVAVSNERDEANRQRDRAVVSEAEANKSFQAAEKARSIAVEQEQKASRVAYNSTLSEASAQLGTDLMMARFLLEDEVRCPPRQRDFVWHCLMKQVVREQFAIPMSKPKSFALSYSPDGEVLATGGGSPGEVVLWNTQTGKQMATLQTELESVDRLVFALDGSSIAVAREEYLPATPPDRSMLTKVQVWDIASRERRFDRQFSVPQINMLCATEQGYFLHAFLSEFEYASMHPEYEDATLPATDEMGQLINRWYQWRRHDLQTGEQVTKVLQVGEEFDLAEGFYVHGKWLTTPCHTAEGEYLWLYDVENQTGKTIRIGPATTNKSSLLIGSNPESAFFFGLRYVEESVSEIDSLAYLDEIEFDTELLFHKLDFDGPPTQLGIDLGRVHSGVFVEGDRNQFVATDRQGSVLAAAMEGRPVVQLVRLGDSLETHWIPAHLGDVVSIAVSPDGKQLASIGLDQSLRLWSIADLAKPRQQFAPSVERPRRLLFTPAGEAAILLALGPDTSDEGIDYSQPLPPGETEYPTPMLFEMERFELADATSLATRDFLDPPRHKPTQGKNALGIFGNFSEGLGEAIAGSFDVNPVQNELTDAKLSNDAKHLILAGPERLLRFELQSGKGEELWGEHYPDLVQPVEIKQIVVSDDLTRFATLLEEDRTVQIYDLDTQQLLWKLPAGGGKVGRLKFVPGGHTLMTLKSADGLPGSSAHTVCELVDVDSKKSRTIRLPLVQTETLLHFSADGDYLVIFQQYDREVLVIDLKTGETVSQVSVVREVPGGMLPGDELLMLFGERGELKLWDLQLDQYRATLHVFSGEAISSAVLSRDGKVLVVLGEQGNLKLLGADRLRDDLADVHTLMNVPLISPDSISPQEPVEDLSGPEERFPQIEVLDEIPNLPATRPEGANDGIPLPPAPAPIPPAPIIDNDA